MGWHWPSRSTGCGWQLTRGEQAGESGFLSSFFFHLAAARQRVSGRYIKIMLLDKASRSAVHRIINAEQLYSAGLSYDDNLPPRTFFAEETLNKERTGGQILC
jgi:hypothetical protein